MCTKLTELFWLESVLPPTESGPGLSSTSPLKIIIQLVQQTITANSREKKQLRVNIRFFSDVCNKLIDIILNADYLVSPFI